MTDAERKLWRLLREAFGEQHDKTVDAARTRIIEDEGYRMIRFWKS